MRFLVGVSRRLQFRVLTAPPYDPSAPLLGSVSELFANLELDHAPEPEPTRRLLRWAIPISFVVGGAITFFMVRGEGRMPAGASLGYLDQETWSMIVAQLVGN